MAGFKSSYNDEISTLQKLEWAKYNSYKLPPPEYGLGVLMQCSGRFDGDSAQKLADWQVQFEACLRGEAAPPRELLRMIPDIQNHMRAAQSRFLFFKMDTVKTTTLVRGTASGQTVFIGFQPGVDVMVRLAKLPDVITEPVFAVEPYILAFTATYQKASRLPLVHLLKPDGSTRALLTSGSDGCHVFGCVVLVYTILLLIFLQASINRIISADKSGYRNTSNLEASHDQFFLLRF